MHGPGSPASSLTMTRWGWPPPWEKDDLKLLKVIRRLQSECVKIKELLEYKVTKN